MPLVGFQTYNDDLGTTPGTLTTAAATAAATTATATTTSRAATSTAATTTTTTTAATTASAESTFREKDPDQQTILLQVLSQTRHSEVIELTLSPAMPIHIGCLWYQKDWNTNLDHRRADRRRRVHHAQEDHHDHEE